MHSCRVLVPGALGRVVGRLDQLLDLGCHNAEFPRGAARTTAHANVIGARSGSCTPGLWTVTLPCDEQEEARLYLEFDGVPYHATARWPAPAQDMPEAPAPKRKSRTRKRS
jgi:hypothetical protein